MPANLALGAPGVYTQPDEIRRTLSAQAMDVCAFVGVAPRGPCRQPVAPENFDEHHPYVEAVWERRRSVAIAVESWDHYRRLFGGFDGPGRLPYAVAQFFEQGGRRAYIVRIVHDYGASAAVPSYLGNSDDDLAGVAEVTLDGFFSAAVPVTLRAKNEGAWGNFLRVGLSFRATPVDFFSATSESASFTGSSQIGPGVLLRLLHSSWSEAQYRFVEDVRQEGTATRRSFHIVVDFATLPSPPERIEILHGELLIRDLQLGIEERFSQLGLSPRHPRWLATVLHRESELVDPGADWLYLELIPVTADDVDLGLGLNAQTRMLAFGGGEDRYSDIVHSDFFDFQWVPGNDSPGAGIHALALLEDLSLLVVPDLYVPEPLPEKTEFDPAQILSNADFATCVDIPGNRLEFALPEAELPGLVLDPQLPDGLREISRLQTLVLNFTQAVREFVLLLDVPPGLSSRQILDWRTQFDSPYVAAYHPWLNISSSEDAREGLVKINPSAVAAGLIARQELTAGVSFGPGNLLAKDVVSLVDAVGDRQHDQFHPSGINCYRDYRDGVVLTAARTLSRDPFQRQLSVVRLMTRLRRTLLRQMQWVVFEPNNANLWLDLRFKLTAFLRQLYIGGAFKGTRETEAFFVRCDGTLNTPAVIDAGRLIAEIGVAPTEPLEFIVLRLQRGADGTLSIED